VWYGEFLFEVSILLEVTMRIDWYTKAVLTVIAIMLTVIACKPLVSPETTVSASFCGKEADNRPCKPLVSPETTVSAQGAPFAGVQFSDWGFFDTRTGEIYHYYNNGTLGFKHRLTKLGEPLVVEYKKN
jgi:hypothetical protein